MKSNRQAELIVFTDLYFLMVESLLEESKSDGHQFIQRTIDDWNSGANKFSQPGEKLWGLVIGAELVAIGGLNHDPYAEDPAVGRVRHLYVGLAHRKRGYARLLMQTIIENAKRHFVILRLFTDSAVAGSFYETLGFEKSTAFKSNYMLPLQSVNNDQNARPLKGN